MDAHRRSRGDGRVYPEAEARHGEVPGRGEGGQGAGHHRLVHTRRFRTGHRD